MSEFGVPAGPIVQPTSAPSTTNIGTTGEVTKGRPEVCLLHFVVKGITLFSFLFGSFLFGGWTGDYVFSFVSTTILVSVDFWLVKNVTGRLLVGMRWSNAVDENGQSQWVFESLVDEGRINTADKTAFWVGLTGWPLLWIILFFNYLFRLEMEWVLLVIICFTLAASNLVGFWKCSKDSSRKLQQLASSHLLAMLSQRFKTLFPS